MRHGGALGPRWYPRQRGADAGPTGASMRAAPTVCRRASGVAEGIDTAEGTQAPTAIPSTAIVIRPHGEKASSEANFRRDSQRVTPRIGPAWLDRDPATGGRDRR